MKAKPPERDTKGLVSRIFHHVQQGARPSELQELLLKDGHTVSREHISRIVWAAVENKRLRYVPDKEDVLAMELQSHVRSVWGPAAARVSVQVASAASGAQMAVFAAEALLAVIKQRWEEKGRDSRPLRVGFGGGITCALIIEELAKLIREEWKPALAPANSFPRSLVFHATNGLLANGDPELNPCRYFPAFENDFPVKTKFFLFPAPGILLDSDRKALLSIHLVQESLHYADKLDVILGSGGHWGQEHKTVWEYVNASCDEEHAAASGKTDSIFNQWQKEARRLAEAGCIGDLFWQPVFKRQSKESASRNIRVTSMFELADLPRFIERGTRVLVVLGPCAGCARPKDDLLEAIVNHTARPLVTDLIVTTKSASGYLQRL